MVRNTSATLGFDLLLMVGGFAVGKKLLIEMKQTGTIDVFAFYKYGLRHIYPSVLLYLIVNTAISYSQQSDKHFAEEWWLALFANNFFQKQRSFDNHHTWVIAVFVQLSAVAPLIIMAEAKLKKPKITMFLILFSWIYGTLVVAIKYPKQDTLNTFLLAKLDQTHLHWKDWNTI